MQLSDSLSLSELVRSCPSAGRKGNPYAYTRHDTEVPVLPAGQEAHLQI